MSEVCIAIRRDGKQQARILHKRAPSAVAHAELYENRGSFLADWKEASKHIVAPVDYGLVVVDFDQKWAAGIQDCVSLDACYFYGTNDPEVKEEMRALWNQGRIEGFRESSQDIVSTPQKTFPAWWKALQAYQKQTDRTTSICLKVAPFPGWTVHGYDNDQLGWSTFARELLARHWTFSKREMQGWTDFAAEHGFSVDPMGQGRAEFAAGHLEGATVPARNAPATRRF